MNKPSTLLIESTWKKGNKRCKVRSTREFVSGCLNMISEISFAGDNPFPCYQMTSTFNVLAAWMLENGWTKEPGGQTITYYDVIDDNTGEVITTYRNVTKTVSIMERK